MSHKHQIMLTLSISFRADLVVAAPTSYCVEHSGPPRKCGPTHATTTTEGLRVMGTFDEGARVRAGESLKFKAQSEGVTQADLAASMGVSASTVSKVWSGLLKRPLHYVGMATALGFTLEEALGQEDRAGMSGKVIRLGVSPSGPSCHVITVAARKGGSTKTTTSVHLAGGFARMGLRCLLVDLDGQRDSTEWLVDAEVEIGVTADDVLRRGVDPALAIVSI